MKILFLTITKITDISIGGIYNDLVHKFQVEGHDIYIAMANERRYNDNIKLVKKDNVIILPINTLNIQKTNNLERGISTLLIDYQFLRKIKKSFSNIRFDLILYTTPPINFINVVRYFKQKDNAISYLLLKDIFPQNAVDLGMLNKGGLLYKYFRKKEKKIYELSDYIGCMSPANVDYILKHNPVINHSKVEVNPNSIEPRSNIISEERKISIRKNYKIPVNSTVFVYGGNLGRPQGIGFLIEFLDSQIERQDIFFIIIGSGTEYCHIEKWFNKMNPQNALLLSEIPKNEFDSLIQSCDVGLLFLDKRFTIPNFPSRLLSYLEFKMPVIASTDRSTDIGKIITENGFGLWSESGDLKSLILNVDYLTNNKSEIDVMGNNGFKFMMNNYTVSASYLKILKHFDNVQITI
jgi:glycosyltransferase involved in cell wall biosynthesis